MRPKRPTAAAAIRSTCARSPTSATTWMASPPAALMRSTMSPSVCSLREARTSLAPSLAAASAVARPMPLEAPVMTMTC